MKARSLIMLIPLLFLLVACQPDRTTILQRNTYINQTNVTNITNNISGGSGQWIISPDNQTVVNASNDDVNISVAGSSDIISVTYGGTHYEIDVNGSDIHNINELTAEEILFGYYYLAGTELASIANDFIINAATGEVILKDNGVDYAWITDTRATFNDQVYVNGTGHSYVYIEAEGGTYDPYLMFVNDGVIEGGLYMDDSANDILCAFWTSNPASTYWCLGSSGITLSQTTTFSNNMYAQKSIYFDAYGLLEKNDATPDISKTGNIAFTFCTSSCTITDFDNIHSPMRFTIICADTNTALRDSSPLYLNGNFACTKVYDTISLVTTDGNYWTETARSNN